VRYRPPEGGGIRVDTGVFEGAEITVYYDPMIAKLVAAGNDRHEATERLQAALDAFHIAGVQHNIAFLAAITASDRFRRGALSTDFIAEEFPTGFGAPSGLTEADEVILIAAALAETRLHESEIAGNGARPGMAVYPPRLLSVLLDGHPCRVSVAAEGGAYRVERGGDSWMAATDWRPGNPVMHLRVEDRLVAVQVERLRGRGFRLVHGGVIRRVQVLPPRAAELLQKMPEKTPADTSRLVMSPMPGLLAQLIVEEGQEVKAGEPLAIVEAMKMENVLRAGRDGRIVRLLAKSGDSLAVDQVILELE
jgi:propionyl-CoA carboxylase alpha chain